MNIPMLLKWIFHFITILKKVSLKGQMGNMTSRKLGMFNPLQHIPQNGCASFCEKSFSKTLEHNSKIL